MARCQARTPDRERVLRPLRRLCPACGGAMRIRYQNCRTLVMLSGTVRMHLKIRRCEVEDCARYHRPYRPEAEGALALPEHEFGLDVIALVGRLRHRDHRSVPEIHALLRERSGVWRVTEVTTTGRNASTNKSPQPSLYIYTAKYYSLIRVNGTTARPDLPEDPTKATAAQLLANWGPSGFAAQAGTYELAGGKLTTRALVARGTRPMAAGAFSTSSYKLDGKTLTITQERGFNGKPVENPTTWKLTRIE